MKNIFFKDSIFIDYRIIDKKLYIYKGYIGKYYEAEKYFIKLYNYLVELSVGSATYKSYYDEYRELNLILFNKDKNFYNNFYSTNNKLFIYENK